MYENKIYKKNMNKKIIPVIPVLLTFYVCLDHQIYCLDNVYYWHSTYW